MQIILFANGGGCARTGACFFEAVHVFNTKEASRHHHVCQGRLCGSSCLQMRGCARLFKAGCADHVVANGGFLKAILRRKFQKFYQFYTGICEDHMRIAWGLHGAYENHRDATGHAGGVATGPQWLWKSH